MAICKSCGAKYSKWTTPVSANGLCADCFESVLSNEREFKPEEPISLSEIAPAEKRNIRIRLTSFLPRSRSKAVFALAMACYCVALGYFIIAWARALHIRPPPPSFYLSGGVGDVVGLLVCPNHRVTHFSCRVRVGSTSTRARCGSGDYRSIVRQRIAYLALVGARGDCAAQLLHSIRFLPLLASHFVEDSVLGGSVDSRPKQLHCRCQRHRASHTAWPPTHVSDRSNTLGEKPLLFSRVES
jgi:hypothetical protein